MTDRYAVIGNPISHSKSPQIHKMFAQQTGQDISYEAILAPLDGFASTIERLRKEGYKGCNVTVPFKFEAFSYVSHVHGQLTDRASTAKAVNTLSFDGSAIRGDNTDGVGLVTDIKHNYNFTLEDRRVLLMGTGGAASGVTAPLLEEMCQITIGYRNSEKAQVLVEHGTALRTLKIQSDSMTPLLNSRSYASLAERSDTDNPAFDLIINATSSGLTNEMPPLPPGIFASGALAYDMMYGRETPFMKFAREHGAAIVTDGLGMLVEQAAESFYIWRGVRPDTASVIAKLRTHQ